MGWAPGDEALKVKAGIQVSKSRAEVYKLLQAVRDIEHKEKREVLMHNIKTVTDGLDSIEFTLSR
jgi:hypothetical protein